MWSCGHSKTTDYSIGLQICVIREEKRRGCGRGFCILQVERKHLPCIFFKIMVLVSLKFCSKPFLPCLFNYLKAFLSSTGFES